MELSEPPPGAIEIRLNAYAGSPASLYVTEALGPNPSADRLSLKKLEDELRTLYGRPKAESITRSLNEEEVVAVMHLEYRSWHRGKILKILNLLTGIRYQILLLDYGNVITVKHDNLRILPTSLIDFPRQARLVKLFGILPCSLQIDYAANMMRNEITDVWTPISLKYIADVVKRYKQAFFVASVEATDLGGDDVLYGDIFVALDSKLISLSKELCLKGYAQSSPEQFLKVEKSLSMPSENGDICASVSLNRFATSLSLSLSASCSQSPSDSLSDSSRGKRFMQERLAEIKAMKHERIKQKMVSSASEGSALAATSDSDSARVSAGSGQVTAPSAAASSVSVAKTLSPQLQFLKALRRGDTSDPERSSDSIEQASSSSHSISNGTQKICSPALLNARNLVLVPAGKPLVSSKMNSSGASMKSPKRQLSDDSNDVSSDTFEDRARVSGGSLMNKAFERRRHNMDSSGLSESEESSGSVIRSCALDAEPPVKHLTSGKLLSLASSCAILYPELTLQEKLVRYVLLHGGLPPKRWMDLDSTSFQNHIQMKIKHTYGWRQPLSIQMYAWPAIMQRQNVVMVSSPQHGKTMGYCVPLMDFMLCCEIPKGHGPLVLILCGSCQHVQNVSRQCKRLVSRYEPRRVRVKSAYGLVLDNEIKVDFLNGCEVLVTTPCCLLRLLGIQNIVTNMNRLCHLVFDQADILMLKYLKEVKEILGRMNVMLSQRSEDGEPVQVIAASEKWIPALREYTTHIPANPLLCISDAVEAAIYGKPDVALHLVSSESKAVKVVDLLDGRNGAVKVLIVCASEEEIDLVNKFLQNACHQTLIAKSADSELSLEVVRNSWNISKEGQHNVLICTDAVLPDLYIRDAMCLIHFSLPKDRSFFSGRFSSLGDNYNNIFKENLTQASPKVHFLVDESKESEQTPVVIQFMRRLGKDISSEIISKCEDLRRERERRKGPAPLCQNLKMFGDCWDKFSCPDRHALIPEYDSPLDLPTFGEVKIKVLHVHSASHFSARLLEHTSGDGKPINLQRLYMPLMMQLAEYFSAEKNRIPITKVEIGDVCAFKSNITGNDVYERVKILKKDENKKFVTVQKLDDGLRHTVMLMSLYYLPESFTKVPPQAVDVYLCRLLPGDQDETWGEDTTLCVKEWVKVTQNSDDHKETSTMFCRGKIALALRGALWLDPLHLESWLPKAGLNAIMRNIRTSLIQMQHAVENPQHVLKLYDLCKTSDSFILPPYARATCSKKPLPQPIPRWAFLEEEYEKVIFSYGINLKRFFVRRDKFDQLRLNLMDDIEKEMEKEKNKCIPVLESGNICLARAKESGVWERAQVMTVNDKEVHVFYVDFGDSETVPRQDVTTIPDWAITRLPFQAIECGLVGVEAPKEGWSIESYNYLYDYCEERTTFVKPCIRETSAEYTCGRYYSVLLTDGDTLFNDSVLDKSLALEVPSEREHLETGLNGIPTEMSEEEEDALSESELPEEEVQKAPCDMKQLIEMAAQKEEETMGLDPIEPNIGARAGCSNMQKLMNMAATIEDHTMSSKPIEYDVVDRAPEQEWGMSEDDDDGNSDPLFDISKVSARELADFYNSLMSQASTTHKQSLTAKMPGQSQPLPLPEPQPLPLQQQPQSQPQPLAEQPMSQVVTRTRMPLLNSARLAPVSWSQDLFHLWIKIHVTGALRPSLQWTNNRIQMGVDAGGKKYVTDLKLCGIIVPETLTSHISGFEISIKVQKAVLGIDWPRLLQSSRKYAWLHAEHNDIDSDGSISEDGEVNISRAMRKLPLNKRRRRAKRDEHVVLDACLSDSNSSSDVGENGCGYDSL